MHANGHSIQPRMESVRSCCFSLCMVPEQICNDQTLRMAKGTGKVYISRSSPSCSLIPRYLRTFLPCQSVLRGTLRGSAVMGAIRFIASKQPVLPYQEGSHTHFEDKTVHPAAYNPVPQSWHNRSVRSAEYVVPWVPSAFLLPSIPSRKRTYFVKIFPIGLAFYLQTRNFSSQDSHSFDINHHAPYHVTIHFPLIPAPLSIHNHPARHRLPSETRLDQTGPRCPQLLRRKERSDLP